MNKTILAAMTAMVLMTAAAPAPAQQDGRLSLVFAADSDALTTEALAQISAFARNHRGAQEESVRVEDHATLAESYENSSGYAVGLAQRRAGNVRSALVEEGLPPGAIVIAAYGASRPLQNVPAASSRNRRVELVFAGGSGW